MVRGSGTLRPRALLHPCGNGLGVGVGGEGVCVYFIICGCKTLLSCIFKQTNKPELGSLKGRKKNPTIAIANGPLRDWRRTTALCCICCVLNHELWPCSVLAADFAHSDKRNKACISDVREMILLLLSYMLISLQQGMERWLQCHDGRGNTTYLSLENAGIMFTVYHVRHTCALCAYYVHCIKHTEYLVHIVYAVYIIFAFHGQGVSAW